MSALTRVNALTDLIGSRELGSAVFRTFDLMKIAEEEILAAIRHCPRKRKSLNGSFRALCPNELVRYSDDVYRSHCREILSRLRLGQDLRPGTDAELLVALSEASLRAPPAADYARAMSEVFARVFPARRDIGLAGAEPWPGRTEEILTELRRKIMRDR